MATGPQTSKGFADAIRTKMAELNQLMRDAYDKADVHTSLEDISEKTDQALKLPQFRANPGTFKREGPRPEGPSALPAGVEAI